MFLVEGKASTMSDTVTEVVAYIWARLRQVGYPNSSPSYTAPLPFNVLDFLRLVLSAYLLLPGECQQQSDTRVSQRLGESPATFACRGVTTLSPSLFFYSINFFQAQSPSPSSPSPRFRRSLPFILCLILVLDTEWETYVNPNSKTTCMTLKYGARLLVLPSCIPTMVSKDLLSLSR